MTKFKLLYVSSWHGTLEHDDLKLFTEMGIDWFSTGYYVEPQFPLNSKYLYGKSPIDKEVDAKLVHDFYKLNNPANHGPHKDVNLSVNFVRNFDAVMVVDCCPAPEILLNKLDIFKDAGKPLIWRTYGQQQVWAENTVGIRRRSGYPITIVRGSPKERLTNYYAGEDYIIRPYVDENKFCGYYGDEDYILSFNNFYNQRREVSNTKEYEAVIRGLNSCLYGDESETAPNYSGFLNEDGQLKAYRECKAYFALGSKPAFMTYNMIEAMMVGCPVLTWNKKLGGETFEGPDLFENGRDCFMSDDLTQLRYYAENPWVFKNYLNGRQKAISIFGKEIAKNAWTQLFKEAV